MKRNKKGQFIKRARAANPRRRRKAHRKVHHKRRHNPRVSHRKVHHRRRRSNPIGYVSRPRRRRRVAAAVAVRRRRRSNPRFSIKGILGTVKNAAVPAAAGVAGVIGLDLILGMVPLPAMLQTGMPRHAVRVIAAPILTGIVAGKLLGSEKGAKAATGAMAIALHSLAKDLLGQFAPTVAAKLADYPEFSMNGYDPAAVLSGGVGAYLPPPVQGVGAYMDTGIGAYMSADPSMGDLDL